jgi:ribosomal protein S27E
MPWTMKNGHLARRRKATPAKLDKCPDCGAESSYLVYDKMSKTTECEECGAIFR